jgi:hypothetical protein
MFFVDAPETLEALCRFFQLQPGKLIQRFPRDETVLRFSLGPPSRP